MQMHTDDEVYQVDNVFLGPPRFTFWWRARYQAYAVGGALTVVMLLVLLLLGLLAFWPIAFGLLAVVAVTRKVGTHITYDHGIKDMLTTALNEARAPRQKKHRALTARLSTSSLRRRTYL
ncbi:hypothetical protein [Streptomyces sp. NPDC059009]|uniref:hypothetical protein n=1 Tax=Streptomyces sp. NPDC059009 TaxID=3346694 RepID=UPI003676680B